MCDMEKDPKPSMALPNDDRLYGVPDEETPELTEEAIRRSIPAKQFFAERGLPMPGRPKAETPKVAVSLRRIKKSWTVSRQRARAGRRA